MEHVIYKMERERMDRISEFENKVLNGEDMAILIASSKCYYCLTFEPTINEVFTDNNKTIYRIDIASLTSDEASRFRTYYAFTSTPTIFTIKDGIATSELKGTTTKEELGSWVKAHTV